MGFSLVAKDGYALTFSEDQVVNGSFIAYDPATGDEFKSRLLSQPFWPMSGTASRCRTMRGRCAWPSSAKQGIKRPMDLLVKWVTAAEVKELVQDWVLELNGGLSD